jgi:hypothetical protein
MSRKANEDLSNTDKRLQERRLRLEGKPFEKQQRASMERLPDLGQRVAPREPEELEAFSREFLAEKKLREQRIAKQVRSGGERPSPQSELLPGDTRD